MIESLFVLLCLQQQDRKTQDLQEQVEALEKKVQEIERRQAQAVSANPLTVLNPTLTVVGNFLFRLDDREVFLDDDPVGERIDDTANLREVEIDLRAAVDPYVDGVAILSLESEVPGEVEASVEEFLMKIKSLPLPLWEEPPLGTQLKIGRMRTEFGTNNLLHLHDLPQSNRPLVVEEFLGEEGHIANGVSARMFLPSPGDLAVQLTLQALQGGGIEVAQDRHHAALLGNLHFFMPVGDEHSFDLSAIGFYGTNDEAGHAQSRVGSVDFWYRWKPLRGGEWNSLLVGGQVFFADHEFLLDPADPTLGAGRTHPVGTTVWAQVQLARTLYAGVRHDFTEFIANDTLDRSKIQPYLSWYTSEFFRVRATYEHVTSDDPLEDGRDTFLLEINVVFGAHPTEPFWVNR